MAQHTDTQHLLVNISNGIKKAGMIDSGSTNTASLLKSIELA